MALPDLNTPFDEFMASYQKLEEENMIKIPVINEPLDEYLRKSRKMEEETITLRNPKQKLVPLTPELEKAMENFQAWFFDVDDEETEDNISDTTITNKITDLPGLDTPFDEFMATYKKLEEETMIKIPEINEPLDEYLRNSRKMAEETITLRNPNQRLIPLTPELEKAMENFQAWFFDVDDDDVEGEKFKGNQIEKDKENEQEKLNEERNGNGIEKEEVKESE